MGVRSQLTSRPKIPMALVGPLTVSTTPVNIDVSSIPNGASGAFVANIVGAGDVHFGFHQSELNSGWTDPSTAAGIPLRAGEFIEIYDNIELIKTMRFVRVTTTNGSIAFQFVTE